MTDTSNKRLGPVRRFVHWLFGSPFEELPPEFGDPVPPEWRVFEAETDEIQRHAEGKVPPASARPGRTKPARRDEWLERE
jgi:hypothetical protein